MSWRKKTLFHHLFSGNKPLLRNKNFSRAEIKTQELMQRLRANATYCISLLGLLGHFVLASRITCLGYCKCPTMCCALQYQLWIRKMQYRLVHQSKYWGYFLRWDFMLNVFIDQPVGQILNFGLRNTEILKKIMF